MLKKILIALAALVIVFVIIVALQPATFHVTRSATISAPAAFAFAQVNDFHKWDAWSPWAKLDPTMKQTYEGSPEGKGAIYYWLGNKDVGEGRMTITDSAKNEIVRIKLEFIKPFASINTTEFTFKGDTNQTTVTWDMSGDKNFMSKAMCMFMSMDKMIGGDFEKGLAQMKTVAEDAAKKATPPPQSNP